MYDSIYMKYVETDIHREKADKCLPGAEERGKYDVTARGYRVSFKDDVNIIKFPNCNSCKTL